VRAGCQVLSLFRSHFAATTIRMPDWTDGRKSPPLADDDTIKQAIASMVQERVTYAYRRLWARLRNDEYRINHTRVYLVMRDEGLLMFRQGHKPIDTKKHDCTVAVMESHTCWCSDGLELACYKGERVRAVLALVCCDREVMSWVSYHQRRRCGAGGRFYDASGGEPV
jgi:transposase InsO family protein